MANLLSTSVTGTVNSTGNMTAAGFTGNANVGGTGAATWHPSGIYAGSTQWLYGAMYKNGSSIYDVGELKMNGGPTLQVYNDRNLIVKGSSSSDAGIEGRNAADGNVFQIYGNGTDYGFLNGSWAGWDIRKTKNAAMYMNGDSAYYLHTNSTSNFYALSIQGSAVVHAGNIGSQSVSYASSAGSAPNASNSNSAYNVTPGEGHGIKFWNSDSYKISMGATASLYQYGPVTDYSIKMQMDQGSAGRGFTWGREGVAPVAGLNGTSGNMQIAGTFASSNFSGSHSGSSSGTNTGDQTNISGNAATATTASNLAANTSPTIQVLNFTGVGTNSGNANQSYAIYQEGGAWGSPFPDLCIGYHTGIKLGAYFGYNGIRFYNNSDFATQTFSVNDGDNHVRVAYNLYVGGTISGSNLSGTNTGDQTNISGNAGSVSGLTLTSSANGINPDSVTQNQIGYNNSVSLFGQGDGGLYSSAYSSSWIHQIYGDFRTGQIAIRGKNSGTWQAWRNVLDSSNYTSYAPSLTGSGASGTWSISVSGNAATSTTATSAGSASYARYLPNNYNGDVRTNPQSYFDYQQG